MNSINIIFSRKQTLINQVINKSIGKINMQSITTWGERSADTLVEQHVGTVGLFNAQVQELVSHLGEH